MSPIPEADERISKPPSLEVVEPAAPIPPTPAQKRQMRTARRRVAKEPTRTELRIGPDKWQHPIVGLPHTDPDGWYAQAKMAFGTVSASFVEAEIERLLNALRCRKSSLPLETELNAALAVIEGLQPHNELEAMMAVQMALTHVAAVEMLSRLGQVNPLGNPELAQATGATASKLLRAFAGHVDVLTRSRRPAVQVVRVERVNIEPGAQAVVGTLSGPGGLRRSRG